MAAPLDQTRTTAMPFVDDTGPGTAPAARIPARCLSACLRGDATRAGELGCAWLRAALDDVPSPDLLSAGRCDQGYFADAAPVVLQGERLMLLSVRGTPPAEPPTTSPATVAVMDALQQADQLAVQLRQATSENEGLAGEVLQNYEQLGLLFDVTKEIAGLTRTQDIQQLLLARLGSLLGVPRIDIVRSDGSWRTCDVASAHFQAATERRVEDPALQALAAEALSATVATVKFVGQRRVLMCPLSHFEGDVEVALVTRPHDGPEFTAADLRICEALLTVGSHLINNSKLHDRIRRMSMEATRALVFAIDKKDHYTSGHSQRVGFMSRLTGEVLGLPAPMLDQLEWAGLLHDIGKIGIPEEILNKPGKLTPEEYATIQNHPQMGHDILAPIKAFEHVVDGVLYHHENEDGSGYPTGLEGDEIPIFARIIHVVDVFDALSSTRSYRQAFDAERATAIVREMVAEGKMAPRVVEAFLQAFSDFRETQPEAFEAMFNLRSTPTP